MEDLSFTINSLNRLYHQLYFPGFSVTLTLLAFTISTTAYEYITLRKIYRKIP